MGDEHVLYDVRIREDNEPLVADHEGVDGAEFLRPFVEAELGVLGKVGENPC